MILVESPPKGPPKVHRLSYKLHNTPYKNPRAD